jgi:DNA-binding response OmpR family regulator
LEPSAQCRQVHTRGRVNRIAHTTPCTLAKLLNHATYDVRTAGSVATALQIAAAEAFDVVVSDILPGRLGTLRNIGDSCSNHAMRKLTLTRLDRTAYALPDCINALSWAHMAAAAASLQIKVLIVEDDPSACDMLVRAMNRHGIAADCATTVGEALLKLEQTNTPSAMILDINLPDANGSVLIRRIRRENLETKVAIVTGVRDIEIYSDLLEIPPDAIFSKPVNLAALIRWVQEN